MRLEHLCYGWMAENIDSSGTGFGVLARSSGWNEHLGTIGRELGSLISRPNADNSTLEIALHRGKRLLVRKSQVRSSRQGSHFVHLVDSDNVPTYSCFDLLNSGLLYTSPEQFPDSLPASAARPLEVNLDTVQPNSDTFMASIADRRLSIIGAAVLASLDGAASNIVLVGAPLNELVSLLGSIARMLPSPIADQIRFIGTTGDLDNIDDSETRIVCAETYNRSKRRRSTIVDISVDEVSHIREVQSYFPVIDRLVSWVRDGGLVAGHLATVDELIRWINARELMLRSATELSSAELSAVLSMGDDSVSWLDRPGVLAQVCERAVVDEDVLQALVRLGSSRLRTLTPEICRALYLFDISAGEQRRVLRALAIDGDTYLEHALGAFWAEWRPGILMSEGQRETIFPVIAADAGLAQQENLPVLDELLRSQSFRGYAASGAAPIVSRMLTREFGKSPDARDYFALGAAARRRPGAVVSFMTDGARSRDGRAIAWAIDELDLDNALAVLTETAAAQASSPSVVFDLLAHSSRTEAERRRLLRGVWPLLQQLVGVPPQMRDWLIVAEPSSRSATLQPDDSPLWGKISPQPADHLIPDPVLSTPPNDARPGVMQRIRKIFGITE